MPKTIKEIISKSKRKSRLKPLENVNKGKSIMYNMVVSYKLSKEDSSFDKYDEKIDRIVSKYCGKNGYCDGTGYNLITKTRDVFFFDMPTDIRTKKNEILEKLKSVVKTVKIHFHPSTGRHTFD